MLLDVPPKEKLVACLLAFPKVKIELDVEVVDGFDEVVEVPSPVAVPVVEKI